jgi:hypothetical protein
MMGNHIGPTTPDTVRAEMRRMKVYTCNDFWGFYPVGSAAVVVANDEAEARKLLDAALIERGLRKAVDEASYTLRELAFDAPSAVILVDGDY